MEVSKFKRVRISDIETEATPVNIATVDANGNIKQSTWVNIKALLKTYFDTIYLTVVNFSNLGDGLKSRVDMVATTVINWSLGTSYIHNTLTANATFTDSNLPTGTDTKTISLDIDLSTFSLTLPAYYVSKGGEASATGKTRIVIDCVNGTSASEEVYYILIPNV